MRTLGEAGAGSARSVRSIRKVGAVSSGRSDGGEGDLPLPCRHVSLDTASATVETVVALPVTWR